MTHPKIQPLGAQSLYISMQVVAESGFGKTVLLGSEPSMCILSADPEGTESALYSGSQAQQWIVRDYDDVEEAYRYFRDKGHKEFKWLGIDSGPEIQKIFQKKWIEQNRDKAGKRHPDVLGIDGHQVTQLQLVKFIKQINDLPMHKCWTALPVRLEDSEGDPYYLPGYHGGKGDVAQQVMGYMKVQGYGEFQEKKVKRNGKVETKLVRRYHFQPYGPFKGKDRYNGALGDFMDDPTLPEIEEKISKALPRPSGKKAAGRSTAARKKTTSTRRRSTK